MLLLNVGGGIGGFQPISLAPALWLDAGLSPLYQTYNGNTPPVNTGDTVGYWGDLSGNNNYVQQSTSNSYRPTYQLNAANGLPGILFDGVEDYLVSPSGGPQFLTTMACTAFAVLQPIVGGSAANPRLMCYKYSASGTSDYNTPTGFTTGMLSTSKIFSERNSAVASPNTPLTPRTTYLISIVFSGANMTLYLNGTSLGGPASTGTFSVDQCILGCGWSSSAFMPFTNVIYFAAMAFNSALSTANRVNVETYLANRFGLAGVT